MSQALPYNSTRIFTGRVVLVTTVVVVAAFKSSTALTNAYGYVASMSSVYTVLISIYSFAVATVMFVTTILISIQIRYVKHQPLLLALAFFLAFGFFDGKYWTSHNFYLCLTNGL